tara:strand:+ start:4853 stop:5320 length:468 start_codon:yes stop_codon:yes gene_type:complete
MTDDMIKEMTKTPLDCVCKGEGFLPKIDMPCATHYLYYIDEEFRETQLQLYISNFKALILELINQRPELENHRNVGFPTNEEELQSFVDLFWQPVNTSEELKAYQTFVRVLFSFIKRSKQQRPSAVSVDLFSQDEISLTQDSGFIWKPLFISNDI